MPFILRREVPDESDFSIEQLEDTSLASSKDTLKQINQLRKARQIPPLVGRGVGARAGTGNLRAVREVRSGEVQGYIVSSADSRTRTIKIEDLFVVEAARHQGIGGFLLGDMVVGRHFSHDYTPERTLIDYGETLLVGDQSYRLPGEHYVTSAYRSGDEGASFRKLPLVDGWTGIKSLRGDSPMQSSHIVYDRGQEVAELVEAGYADVRILGEPQNHEMLAFAAMAVLSRRSA